MDKDFNIFEVDVKLIKKWFRYYNNLYFDNKIKIHPNIEFQESISDCYAVYFYHERYNIDLDDCPDGLLAFHKKYMSDIFFYETLLHEMIHVLDYQENNKATHGKFFRAWKKKFKKIGISI